MKQYRIGIIGTENSHAQGFARLINLPDENGNLRYPDCHINLVYGYYPESSEKLVNEFNVDAVADSIEEMLDNVDAVMVTARDGKFHYEFAKPFIEAGKPCFIDKPFTVDKNEAIELIDLAKKNGVSLCGGSSLKYSAEVQELSKVVNDKNEEIFGGSVAAPVQLDSEYSGFYFYASHLVEMTLEIFGYNPQSVMAVENNGSVCAVIDYDKYSVSNHFNNYACDYAASIYKKSDAFSMKIWLDNIEEKECNDFVNMLRTGEMPQTYEQLIKPIYYMNAVKRAYETGKKVFFDEI